MRDYTKIEAWKLADDLTVAVYERTRTFPFLLHLSHRLGYLSDSSYRHLAEQVKVTFGCLHGLVRAVERESSKLAKGAALVTSSLILCLARFATVLLSVPLPSGPWFCGPVVSGPVVWNGRSERR